MASRKENTSRYFILNSQLHRPDAIQSLSYALCHVYARATRSVSIPAPVYCKNGFIKQIYSDGLISTLDADIVCSRARNHFDPSEHWGALDSEDTGSGDASGDKPMFDTLELFQKGFKPVHKNQKTVMYFSVSVFVFWSE